jgi:hypothetical protein
MAIEKVKSSTFYKLMKTTEAVVMIALPIIFGFLGLFNWAPVMILVGSYVALNLTQYSDKALWQTRDAVVDSTEDLKKEIKELKEELKSLKNK